MNGDLFGDRIQASQVHPSESVAAAPATSSLIQVIEKSFVARYAVAVLSTVVAMAALMASMKYLQVEPYVSLFLCAIIFVTWIGGLGPGLLTVALSVVAFDYLLMRSGNSFKGEYRELPRLLLFLLPALFVIWIIAMQRRTTRSLQKSQLGLLAAIESQKRTEARLLRSEMYLAEAQRLSRTGSFGWKVNTNEIAWSDETFRIFECEPTTAPNPEVIVQRVHPEDRELAQRNLLRAREGAREFDHEHRLLMPDGTVKHIRAMAHAVTDESGNFEFIGAVTDITAAKQAEAALQDARASLAHATRVMMLGELTTSIAHEVNQPLAAALSNAEACVRWLDRGTSHLNRANLSVQRVIGDVTRAAQVIRRVRALASRTANEYSVFDVNELVHEAIALLRRELLRNGIVVRLQTAPAPLPVRADRIQVQQVIINLVMNGIEAMQNVTDRARELTIRTRSEDDKIYLAVEDRGIGIAPDGTERVFEAFFTTKPQGLGLGLSICRSIIEAHDGKLSAVPNEGPGATFQFTLPLHHEA